MNHVHQDEEVARRRSSLTRTTSTLHPNTLAIFNATHGLPREVNRLAKLALEHAWVSDSAKVEASAVTAVVRDLERHQLLPA